MAFDVLISGGTIVDPAQGLFADMRIAFYLTAQAV
jgi:hypothetical protein